MTKRFATTLLAAAIVSLFSISLASAQTAGSSFLDNVRELVKQDYGYSLSNDGSFLVLNSRSNNSDEMSVSLTSHPSHSAVTLRAVVGDLSPMSNERKAEIRSRISFMNTTLAMGTLVEEKSGTIMFEHSVNRQIVVPSDVVALISTFSREIVRQRVELFG